MGKGGFDVLFFGPPSKLPSDLLRSAPTASSVIDFTSPSPPINLTSRREHDDDYHQEDDYQHDDDLRQSHHQSTKLKESSHRLRHSRRLRHESVHRSSIFQSHERHGRSISSSRLKRSRSRSKRRKRDFTDLPSQTQKLVSTVTESGTREQSRRLRAVVKRLRKGKPKDVFLKIYDITDGRASQWLRPLLGTQVEGIWHTGILCHGKEHFYCDGIQSMAPEVVEVKFAMTLRDILYIGKTKLSERKFHQWIRDEEPRFTREKYDLINWNCNHFTMLAIPKLFPFPAETFEEARRKYPKAASWPGLPDYVVDQPRLFMATVRGRILVWMTKHVLERVDNFLNQHFAQGLDEIINKLFKR